MLAAETVFSAPASGRVRALQRNTVIEIAAPHFEDPLLQPCYGFEDPPQAEIRPGQNEAHQDQQQDHRSGDLEIGQRGADLENELPGGLLESAFAAGLSSSWIQDIAGRGAMLFQGVTIGNNL
jgi:hypothetical protein